MARLAIRWSVPYMVEPCQAHIVLLLLVPLLLLHCVQVHSPSGGTSTVDSSVQSLRLPTTIVLWLLRVMFSCAQVSSLYSHWQPCAPFQLIPVSDVSDDNQTGSLRLLLLLLIHLQSYTRSRLSCLRCICRPISVEPPVVPLLKPN